MPNALAGSELFERFSQLRSGRERPGRYWRIDIDAVAPPAGTPPYVAPSITAPPIRGGFAVDLQTARASHGAILDAARGRAIAFEEQKFAALAAARCNSGALVYVPDGVSVDEPVRIAYEASQAGLYPYTLVVAGRGARCTVVVTLDGGPASFVCGIDEVIAGEDASVTFASIQRLPDDATAIFTRGARPGRASTIEWSAAHLGAHLTLDSIDCSIDEPGVAANVNAVFFPRGTQHVDMTSTLAHNAGSSQSQTLVKSAATGSGQARFLGTIRIAPHAQQTEASLRDDALLLSKSAHIDSVPALEIAANDVKAFHGATVGALDEEQIFYMTSRGIGREQAERMIALGFFEPAVERFPTHELREELRAALQAKAAS